MAAKKKATAKKASKKTSKKKSAKSAAKKKSVRRTAKKAVRTSGKATSKKSAGKAASKKKRAEKKPTRRKASSSTKKLSAGMTKVVERLENQRSEILDLYRHDLGVGVGSRNDGDDEVDRANFDADRELALALSNGEREVLLQIEEAFGRVDRGEYGDCTSCQRPIGEQRLHAIPWARYCIDCQELEEKGLLE